MVLTTLKKNLRYRRSTIMLCFYTYFQNGKKRFTNFGHKVSKFEKYLRWVWTCMYILNQEAKTKLFGKMSVCPKNFCTLKLENG